MGWDNRISCWDVTGLKTVESFGLAFNKATTLIDIVNRYVLMNYLHYVYMKLTPK